MASVTGKIKNIKVGSFQPGTANSADVGAFTLVDNAPPNTSWLFYIWNAKDAEPALRRVLHSQRLALVREAAFRKLNVTVTHQTDSSLLDTILVEIP